MTSFILMGEIMFQSKMAPDMLDALDKWLGRLPGRLGLLAVGGGTLFSTLTGVSMASVAMLGSSLVPEMEARGYKKPMSLGPILGSGGLALMIPPSGLAVLLGALAEISIGKILIAIIIPGILLSVLYTAYIIIRCWLQPSIAPAYSVPPIPLMKKILTTVKYIFPIGIIIFLVIGVIILGIATPTEASALGAFGTFVLVAAYGKLNWQVVKNSLNGTLHTTVMIFMIIVGAKVFSQVLAASGAMQGAIKFTLGLPLSPILILIAMQLVLLFMGTFVTVVSIMLITVPLFMPVVEALGFHPVWFAVLFLLNSEMATTTPPFGLSLFVMKGVAPPDTAMEPFQA
jgi:tripartite ATP-independent transporter DctM subunit